MKATMYGSVNWRMGKDNAAMKPPWSSGPQAYRPDSPAFDEAYYCLDSDFRVVLKKMNKRDVTTKRKALKEFSTLCEEKDDYTLRAVLPFWPTIYNKLAIDFDPTVREDMQKAMATLVGRVRGNLAPYLKDVMGVWFLSCNDSNPIVATAANRSFSAAFSPEKRKSAILFCKHAVVEYLTDNLVNQTPSSLCDPKTTKKEDMAWKYQFVVMSSFVGLHRLLQELPRSEVDDELKGRLHGFLSRTAFWNQAFLQVHSVTTCSSLAEDEVLKELCVGVFWCLSSVCQVVPDVAAEHIHMIGSLLLANMQNMTPGLSNAVWDSMVSCAKCVPTFCEEISWQTTFWPQLMNVLENGCLGNAANVAPNFLPLFSCIPMEAAGGTTVFFPKVLELLRLGFSKDCVISSSSATYAWTRAFTECLQFAFNDISTSGAKASHDVLKAILLDQLLPVVEASLYAPKHALSNSVLHSFVSSFLKDVEANPDTVFLAADFWSQLSESLVEILEIMGYDNLCLNSIIMFVNVLLYPKDASKSSKGESKRVICTAAEEEETGLQQSGGSVVVEVCDGLTSLVKKLVVYSHRLYWKDRHSIYLKLFFDLASLYFPEDVAAFVLHSLHSGTESGEVTSKGMADGRENSTTDVYSNIIGLVVLPVLGGREIEDELVEHALAFLFACLPYMTKESSAKVWGSVLQAVISNTVLCRLLEMAVEKRHLIPNISDWLSSARLHSRLYYLVAVITSRHFLMPPKEIEQGLKIVCLILSANDNSVAFPAEPLFPSSWIVEIMYRIGQRFTILASCLEEQIQLVIQFMAKAALTFFQNRKISLCIDESYEMILTLLMADLTSNLPLSEQERSVLRHSWTTGLGLAVRETGFLHQDSILFSACAVIRDTLATMTYTTKQYNKVIEVTEELLKTSLQHLPKQNASDSDETYHQHLSTLLLYMLVTPSTFPTHSNEVIQYRCLTGKISINCLFPDICPCCGVHTKEDTHPQTMTSVVLSSMFNLHMLWNMHLGVEMQDTGCGGEKRDSPPALWRGEELWEAVMLSAVRSLCLASTWCKIQPDAPLELINAVDVLTNIIEDWFFAVSKTVQKNVIRIAFTSILDNPEYCSPFTYLAELQCAQAGMVDQGYFAHLIHSSQMGDLRPYGWGVEALVPFLPQKLTAELFRFHAAMLNSRHNTDDLQTVASVRIASVRMMTAAVSNKSAFSSSTYADIQTIVIKMVAMWDHDEHSEVFLTQCCQKQQVVVAVNVAIMQFLRTLVTSGGFPMTTNLWDVILCKLLSSVKSLDRFNVSLQSPMTVQALCVDTCRLVAAVAGVIDDPEEKDICPRQLKTEWTGIFSSLFPLFLKLTKQLKEIQTSRGTEAVIVSAVGSALSHCPEGQITAHNLPLYLKSSDQALYVPESPQTVLNHLCPMLMCAFPSVQHVVYCVLTTNVIPLLPSHHEQQRVGATVSASASESDIRAPPAALMKVIDDCAISMDLVLTPFPMEATIILVKGTEEHQFALGYLLAWHLLLRLLHSADSMGHAEYAAYLKEQCYVQHLLQHLFHLMPLSPASSLSATSSSEGVEYLFSSSDLPSSPDDMTSIHQVSYWLYIHCLRVIPLLVRQWWKDQVKDTAAYISTFTMQGASQQRICSELEAISSSCMNDTMVNTNPVTRQVTAYMTEEPKELQSEIQVTLPENYPLGKITVIGARHAYFKQTQWNRLLVRIRKFLQYQKGPIMEGLRMWKRTIEKLEDEEKCYICYAVRHHKHIPEMPCTTCKNKFHAACLLLWLNVHESRTCPVCRSVFS